MTTNFHTPIPVASPANAATFNTVYEELDAAMTNLTGGTNAQDKFLLAYWPVAMERFVSAPIPNGTYPDIIQFVDVVWPDGSDGEYTCITIDPTWLEVVHWTLSHTDSGKLLTFSGLVRDANGFITVPGTFVVS